MYRYQVDFHQSGVQMVSENFNTLKECKEVCVEFVRDVMEVCTSKKGFQKKVSKNCWTVVHKGFGFEAGAYIKKIVQTRNGQELESF